MLIRNPMVSSYKTIFLLRTQKAKGTLSIRFLNPLSNYTLIMKSFHFISSKDMILFLFFSKDAFQLWHMTYWQIIILTNLEVSVSLSRNHICFWNFPSVHHFIHIRMTFLLINFFFKFRYVWLNGKRSFSPKYRFN